MKRLMSTVVPLLVAAAWMFGPGATVAAAQMVISPAVLPAMTEGTAVNVTLTTAGGCGGGAGCGYSYAVTAGTLPSGLSLAAGGALTGTPKTAGAYTFTVTVTDIPPIMTDPSADRSRTFATMTRVYSGTIAPPFVLSPATLPAMTQGTAVNVTLTSTGGCGGGAGCGYSYAVTAGALPSGLTLATGGALTGTPTTAGAYTFTVTVTDIAPILEDAATDGRSRLMATATRVYSGTIASAAAIVIAPATLPAMTVGTPVSVTLTGSNGCGGGACTYSYAVTSGAVPAGLTLSTAGLLSGTPTTAGEYSFGVTVSDAGVAESGAAGDSASLMATGTATYTGVVAMAVPTMPTVMLLLLGVLLLGGVAFILRGQFA